MFDLDPGKLLVIGIVALVAIPSKDLPRVLRALGQATGRMRRMAAEFQGQFMEAMREAELDSLRKEIDATKTAIRNPIDLDSAFDPLIEARKQMTEAIAAQTKLTPPKPAQASVVQSEPDTNPDSGGDARA
jgi:sec-independent protein translocase protein TatB